MTFNLTALIPASFGDEVEVEAFVASTPTAIDAVTVPVPTYLDSSIQRSTTLDGLSYCGGSYDVVITHLGSGTTAVYEGLNVSNVAISGFARVAGSTADNTTVVRCVSFCFVLLLLFPSTLPPPRLFKSNLSTAFASRVPAFRWETRM